MDEIQPLIVLCREGRLYEVERWIADGRPLQAEPTAQPWRAAAMPGTIAFKRRNWSLLQLLLVNGYDLRLDPGVLDDAIAAREWSYVDLLLLWGADPVQVDAELLLATYRRDVVDRFWKAGARFDVRSMALALTRGNKPVCGFAKNHRGDDPNIQKALNIALGHAIESRKIRAAALCLWAGADPHVDAPDLERIDDEEPYWSAMDRAAARGGAEAVKLLRPDPAVEDFNELFGLAPTRRRSTRWRTSASRATGTR